MYSYSAGSPGTFSGPRPIDVRGPGYGSYLQEGKPLSYAPRFGETNAQAQSSGGWADVINAAIAGTAAIFTMSTQAKLAKQQQHQAERERAAQLELAKTQAMYVGGGSIVPAQGSHVTVATGAPAPRRGMGTAVMLLGGVGMAGVLWALLGRKRRRNPRRRRRRR